MNLLIAEYAIIAWASLSIIVVHHSELLLTLGLSGSALILVVALYTADVPFRLLPPPRVPQSLGLWCCFLIIIAKFLSWQGHPESGIWFPILVSVSLCGVTARVHQEETIIWSSTAILLPWFVASFTGVTILLSAIYFGTSTVPLTGWVIVLIVIMPFLLMQTSRTILTQPNSSFSYGELQLVLQGIALFVILWGLPVQVNWSIVAFQTKLLDLFRCGIIITLWLVGSNFFVPSLQNTFLFYASFGIGLATGYLMWVWRHNEDLFWWTSTYVFSEKSKIWLIVFWALCTVGAFIYTVITSKPLSTHRNGDMGVSTAGRKPFHFIILLIYCSGLLVHPEILIIASVIVGCGFVVIELIRVLDIPPVGAYLDVILRQMADEKDAGPLILTHIYLFVGTFCPLWIHPVISVSDVKLMHFAGVICIGFGDSAASIGGSMFGRNYWPGLKKTMEGTVCCFLAELLAVLLTAMALPQVVIPVTTAKVLLIANGCLTVALLEAFTPHVDNLVLPLVLFSMLCCDL